MGFRSASDSSPSKAHSPIPHPPILGYYVRSGTTSLTVKQATDVPSFLPTILSSSPLSSLLSPLLSLLLSFPFLDSYELMALCWHPSTKSCPTFVFLVSLLEKDLTDNFREMSFYHSLPPDQVEGLLHSHYEKHMHRTETLESNA